MLFLSLILSCINTFEIIIIIPVGKETVNYFAVILEAWHVHTWKACVVELNENVVVISLIPQGTCCLRNAIRSRKDSLHSAWLCVVFVEVEKCYSYQFSQTVSAGTKV